MGSITPVSHERRYQRYDVDLEGEALDQINISVEGSPVRLVNYSVGGLYFLSMQRFSSNARIHVSFDFGDRGKIELIGRVVQVRNEGDAWGVAVDFSKTFDTPDAL